MKRLHRKKLRGFTIIELMIALVIVAVLIALAYSSYAQYVRKSRRGEAQQLMMNWAINQEIWRSNNATYAGTGDIPVPVNDNYDFDFSVNPTALVYTLRAVGKNDQVYDKARDGSSCTTLTMAHTGVKNPAVCWD